MEGIPAQQKILPLEEITIPVNKISAALVQNPVNGTVSSRLKWGPGRVGAREVGDGGSWS